MEFNSKNFYRKVFALVIPMVLQNLINVGVTAADVIMLGRVSETVLSGASLANQIQFIMTLFLFGLTSGATVLTAQYWGKGDRRTIEEVLGIALRFSAMVALLFFVMAFFFPHLLMRIYTSEPEVIAEGIKYLRIVSFSYLFTAVTVVYLNIIRSIERVIVATVIYSISLLINVAINWTLIYGRFGFPRLEIQGAAIGTLIARFMELLMVLVYAFLINKEIRIHWRDIMKSQKWLVKDFFIYSGPVIVNELMWGMGSSANTAIIGHLGSAAVAANSVAQVERQLATVVAFGLASAASILVGKAIGENQMKLAEIYASKLTKITVLSGIGGAAVILASGPLVRAGMSLSLEAETYLNFMLFVMAYFTVAQAYNSVMVVGIFRGGGDTKFGLALDVGTMWGGSILFGFLAAFVLKWNVLAVYVILMSDELLKIPFTTWRYHSRKWLNKITR